MSPIPSPAKTRRPIAASRHGHPMKTIISPKRSNECQAHLLTPWQECVQIIQNLRRRDTKQLQQQKHGLEQQQKRVLEGQSEEVEFQGADGESINTNGFLFDYLADEPEPSTTQNPFCILDDDDEFFIDILEGQRKSAPTPPNSPR